MKVTTSWLSMALFAAFTFGGLTACHSGDKEGSEEAVSEGGAEEGEAPAEDAKKKKKDAKGKKEPKKAGAKKKKGSK